jgi:ABC-type phosphate/phosphonate transport system substrate-binding protein
VTGPASVPDGAGVAQLAMYPFAAPLAAAQAIWAEVHRRCPWTPPALDQDLALREAWHHPDLVVAQTCGWPLVTELLRGPESSRVQVVGAFHPAVPSGDSYRYRSVLLARRLVDPSTLRQSVAAVNGDDSLSGWVSLLVGTTPLGEAVPDRWPGAVVFTGAHVESIRVLHEGGAEIASIDAVTLAHVQRDHPELIADLHAIGLGPSVPSLPVIAGPGVSAVKLDELRSAFGAVIADASASMREARGAMFVRGFTPLDASDYLPLLDLLPHA